MKKLLLLLLLALLVLVSCDKNSAMDSNETAVENSNVQTENKSGYIVDGDDIHITKDGAVLSDKTIEGDLYIDASVEDGEVTVKSTTVNGTIYILGGGENTVYFISMYGYSTIIRNDDNTRLLVEGNSSLGELLFQSSGTVEHNNSYDSPFDAVTIANHDSTAKINANLKGDYNNVNVGSNADVNVDGNVNDMYVAPNIDDVNVSIENGGYIDSIDSYSKVSVEGASNSLGTAIADVSGSSFPDGISKIASREADVDVIVGDETYTLPKTENNSVGEYDPAVDGTIGGEYHVTGIVSITMDVHGELSPSKLTIKKINVADSRLPATVYYTVVEHGNSIPSKNQIASGGFGVKSGSIAYTEDNDEQGLAIDGFSVKKKTRYTVYFLLKDEDGKLWKITRRNAYVIPTEGQSEEDEGEIPEDEDTNDNSQADDDNMQSNVLLEGYPKVQLGGNGVDVKVSAYESCKVYLLVESPDIFALGTTPSNVKYGESKGVGTTGPNGEQYIVIHKVINVDTALKEYTASISIGGGDGEGSGENGPPPGAQTPCVFVVIEYADGTLSQVYSYK